MKGIILILMIFCHIVDDYYLQVQGTLATMKQKSWWEKNAPESMYKDDYKVALLMHSFSWSFMIMLAPSIYTMFYRGIWCPILALILFIANIMAHMYIDNLKANKRKINLMEDQFMHMIQIYVTWVLLVYWP